MTRRASPLMGATWGAALVVACTAAPTTTPNAPPPSVASAAHAPALPTPDASTDEPKAPVDLIHAVHAVVAVSSKVDNPRDFPEHLVDGKPETAWNGKTGDLGGFIAFRVPSVTRVLAVELTVGFDKRGPEGDLFTMNHRITRVRVSREGVTLREVELDPELRGLQSIAVDAPGGDFRVDVLATAPGTNKKWRELTVSELRVIGYANGAPENPTHLPAMAIGRLDGVVPHKVPPPGEPPRGPFPSVAALCAAYDKAMTPRIDVAFPGDRYPGKIPGPHCAPTPTPTPAQVSSVVGQGPFKSGRFVIVDDPAEQSARLVLETDHGFTLTDVTLWSRYLDDPGCGHAGQHDLEDATLSKNALGQESLVLRVLGTDVYWLGATDPGGTVERAYACTVDSAGAAVCQRPVVVGRAPGWPPGWNLSAGTFPRVDPSTLKWATRAPPMLGPAGDLRVGR